MATKVGELFVSLAIDAASGNLSVNQLVSALGTLDVASATSVGILSKITEVLWGLAKAATGTAVEMSVLRDITGADPKMVQQWEKAAQRINIHAGSIVQSIQAVNTMMGAIEARKSPPPMELTGWLGVTPQKEGVDAAGRPVMKTFFEMMGELADPKSKYWGYADKVKQQLLGGAFPGANAQDLFRILNEMRAGKFHPEKIGVLEDKQVDELTSVRKKETELGQTMIGIFDKLVLGGGALAAVIQSISDKLSVIDKWLASTQGKESLEIVGKEIASIVRNNGNPYKIGRDAGQFIAERVFGFQPPRLPTPPSLKLDDLQGKLDINIFGADGVHLGNKQIFLKRKVGNTEVEHTTINAGNGGLGQ